MLDLGNNVAMKLALIPAGKFMMGSPKDEEGRYGYGMRLLIQGKVDNESPRHEVTISKPFYMGVCLVTQQQYQQVMDKNPSEFRGPQYPVDSVSWYNASELCKKLSEKTGRTVHLPTEAQWEYACRAGTTTPFNTGTTISADQANYKGDDVYGKGKKGEFRRKTTPVGMFKPNAWGLYDMHGNLFQWCADWYGKDYYATGHNIDPVGPASGPDARTTNGPKILRGGSWISPPHDCRSAYRYPDSAVMHHPYFGIRVVVDLPDGQANTK
jgi:formylglycine-generating enzyme required for sulfatase activity